MKTLDEVIDAVENCYCLTEPIRGCDQCPYFGNCNRTGDPFRDDVIHYLKEYRENKSGLEKTKAALEVKKKIYEDMTEKIMQQGQENEARCQAEIARYQEAVKNCERAENLYKQKQKAAEDALWKIASEPNEPLTWAELRTMAGKPVWFEGYAGKFWCIIREVQRNMDGTEDIVLDGPSGMTGIGHDDLYGTRWQAYRKERS